MTSKPRIAQMPYGELLKSKKGNRSATSSSSLDPSRKTVTPSIIIQLDLPVLLEKRASRLASW